MNFFSQLFNKKIRKVPLQKKGDLENEVNIQTKLISNENKLIKVIDLNNDKILLYRILFEDPEEEEEEETIWLRLRIITQKGLLLPEPKLYATTSKENSIKIINLADIEIIEEMASKGYGSLLLKALLEIALKNSVDRIDGWISEVDKDHIDRLKHFYEKHGFNVKINIDFKEHNGIKIGEIYWQKRESNI